MARALTILLCFAISPTSLAACLLPKDVDDFLVRVGDEYFFGAEAEVEIANRYFGVIFMTDEDDVLAGTEAHSHELREEDIHSTTILDHDRSEPSYLLPGPTLGEIETVSFLKSFDDDSVS